METSKDAGYLREEEKVINGNLKLEWSLPWVDGLKLSATGNYRYGFTPYKQWRKDAAVYNWDSKEPLSNNLPSLYNKTDYGYTWTMQFFANYNKTLGKHTITALAGYEETYGYSNSYWLSRENYQFPIDQINPGPEDTQKNGGSESESGPSGVPIVIYVGGISVHSADNVSTDETNYSYSYHATGTQEVRITIDGNEEYRERLDFSAEDQTITISK